MTAERIPDLETVESPPRREDIDYQTVTDGELIGSGGQAVVRKTSISGPDPPDTVAVKEPQVPAQTIETVIKESFFEEANTWAKLARRERTDQYRNSDYIVGVVAVGDDLPWLAMEYMDGGNLADRLDSHPDGLSLDEALWIADCLCEGLKLAHDNGIAHLDLKPENILFRKTPSDTWDVPKIADWGLARSLIADSQSMEMLSVEYAAPEQFHPDEYGKPDTYTDIYQLGAIIYEMLTGQPPYTGAQPEIMHGVINEELPDPPSTLREVIPKKLDDILLDALKTEKPQRYRGSVDRFGDAISEFNQAGSTTTTISSTTQSTKDVDKLQKITEDPITGEVEYINNADDYGYIKPDRDTVDRDVIFTLNSIDGDNPQQGDQLRFTVFQTGQGYRASEITKIESKEKNAGAEVNKTGEQKLNSNTQSVSNDYIPKGESLIDQTKTTSSCVVEYLNYEIIDEQGWDMHSSRAFHNATKANLSKEDHGIIELDSGEYILEAAESEGFDWPYSCRAGACANCAGIVVEGEIKMDMQQILSDEEVDRDIMLTCIAAPVTDEIKIVYNVKHLDRLQNRVI